MPRQSRKRPGLLPRDESPIKLVAPERRRFWEQIPQEASIETASRWRQKWSDDEVKQIVLADPEVDSYDVLARELGRSPGAIRIRRAQMVGILRGEPYALDYVASDDHKRADWRQVHRVMVELGLLELPVTEQFKRAVHLQQPSPSWRVDFTQTVLKAKRTLRRNLKAQLKAIKKSQPKRGPETNE